LVVDTVSIVASPRSTRRRRGFQVSYLGKHEAGGRVGTADKVMHQVPGGTGRRDPEMPVCAPPRAFREPSWRA
jgi:hypothetical protein